jgi:hypothetical protein
LEEESRGARRFIPIAFSSRLTSPWIVFFVCRFSLLVRSTGI